MICNNIQHLFCQNLLGQRIIDLNFNELSKDFQCVNEYDSIDISFQSNRIFRIQCTMRVLYNNMIVFLSNNRFLFDTKDLYDEKCAEFHTRLKELSLLTTNSKIVYVAFAKIGDIKLITNTGFEFQIIIDTRRAACTSYDLWDFDTQSVLCVCCEDGRIVGNQYAIK